MTEESGWVIEQYNSPTYEPQYLVVYGANTTTQYQHLGGEFTWSKQNEHALRFAREIDARYFVSAMIERSKNTPLKDTLAGLRYGDSWPRICEHGWSNSPTPPAKGE